MRYSDHSIAGRLLAGEPECMGKVIRWIAELITSSRFWMLRPEWPDLHQEVLARVIASLREGRFDESRDFRAYVQGVARFTALRALSERLREHPMPLRESSEERTSLSPEERIIHRQLVRRVLDQASEECRELMRAHFVEGKGYAEIARTLGIPVGTAKSRLFRCVEAARQHIGASRQIDDRSPQARESSGVREPRVGDVQRRERHDRPR